MFRNVSLNSLYLLKRLDFFSLDVKLRIQRSRDGGKSDQRIGSWFGVAASMIILIILLFFISDKIDLMNRYHNIVYSTIMIKNEFGNQEEGQLKLGS